MISKESTIKKIQKEISSQNYSEAIKLIEKNKRDLVEIDYWYYLTNQNATMESVMIIVPFGSLQFQK